MLRESPELFPWTELDLRDPVGPFTGLKLAALNDQPDRCLAILGSAGLAEKHFVQSEPVDPRCRIANGVRVQPEGQQSIDYSPRGLVTACPIAAALALWERDVVQPAAMRQFGRPVTRIDHAGSFSCRRIYGRDEGRFSEHATANAVDVIGFRLEGGKSVSVLRDWHGETPEAKFLREVRDGACNLYSTVLSPDYNRAHADHFHLDQADRGAMGWRICS